MQYRLPVQYFGLPYGALKWLSSYALRRAEEWGSAHMTKLAFYFPRCNKRQYLEYGMASLMVVSYGGPDMLPYIRTEERQG
jgi:hypothetical protein